MISIVFKELNTRIPNTKCERTFKDIWKPKVVSEEDAIRLGKKKGQNGCSFNTSCCKQAQEKVQM